MDTVLSRTVVLAMLVAGGCQKGGPSPPIIATPPAAPASENAPAIAEAIAIGLSVVDKAGFQKVLDSKRGQMVLVDFWATWCGPCKKAFPHTVELYEKYKDQGLVVVSVSMDDADAHEEALEFLEQQHASFTNLRCKLGADEQAIEQFEIDNGAIPHLKLYDRQGKLVKKFVSGDLDGAFTPEDVDLAVRELIAKP